MVQLLQLHLWQVGVIGVFKEEILITLAGLVTSKTLLNGINILSVQWSQSLRYRLKDAQMVAPEQTPTNFNA